MINNYDSHGKNVSIYISKAMCAFTPAYDLVNVSMFEQFKHVLAMAMGEEFEPRDIHAYQLADFAETCDLDKKLVSRMLKQLAKKVLETLQEKDFLIDLFESNAISSAEQKYIDSLLNDIKARTAYLLSQAEDIPTIDL